MFLRQLKCCGAVTRVAEPGRERVSGMLDALAGLNITTSRGLQIKASQISGALCCWHVWKGGVPVSFYFLILSGPFACNCAVTVLYAAYWDRFALFITAIPIISSVIQEYVRVIRQEHTYLRGRRCFKTETQSFIWQIARETEFQLYSRANLHKQVTRSRKQSHSKIINIHYELIIGPIQLEKHSCCDCLSEIPHITQLNQGSGWLFKTEHKIQFTFA